MTSYQRLLPYGMAIASTAIALLLSLWLEDLLSRTIGAFFYTAVIVSTWYGGFQPGFVTVVLSLLAIDYFFILPKYQLGISHPKDVLRLALFLIVAVAINLLTSNFRTSKQKVEKLSQQLAQENAEQLRMALSAAQMGMWDWDMVTGKIEWSPEHEILFGLIPGSFDGRYETFDACLYPDDRPAINQALQQALQTHSVYQYEFRVVWPDESIHWVQGRGKAFYNAAGQPIRMTGTVMAIDDRKRSEAERKQAQDALQQSEATLRLFVRYAPAGIAMFDRDMRYVMASQRWVEYYDLDSVEALIGRSHYEIFPEISEQWRQIHQRCLAGAIERSDEDWFVRSDGSQQWIRWEIRPWHTSTGEISGIIIFSDNITLYKQAQIALEQLNTELEQRVAERTEQLREINARLLETLIEQQQTQLILFEQAQLLDLAYDTIMTRDLNGVINFWNEGSEQMYGFLKAEALGQVSHDLLKTQFPQPLPEIEAELLATGYWEGELLNFNQDAQPVIVSSRWVLQKDNAGNPQKILEINNDITAAKQAEKLLEFQAVITRNIAEGVCLVRASDAVIVYANPKFEQMFGYDSGELNGQHISIINYATESVTALDVNQAILAGVLQTGEATYEVHNVKKDGTPFWCSATTSVFSHPEYGDVLVAVHQDITDRKLTQDALRESEEKFRQMADNIQAIFWITDGHYQQLLYVSKAYESIWQRSREELYQNRSAWFEAVHPDDRQRLEIDIDEQAKTGEKDKKYRIIRPDGSIRWIRDRAFPIKNELGEIIRIAGIAEDITEQQELEQMKQEFIGIVSHELRTPLTSIRASLGLLNSDLYKQKPEKSQRMIAIAARETDRLVRLVNDILDLERLDSGRVTLQKTICTAADLFEQAVAGVQAIAKQQNITFNIQPTDTQVCVAADAILQTLTNLLSNAIKFSPADSTITLSVAQQSDRVLFSISDQGRGIPKDKLEKIFTRFQQVDASDSRVKGGTGLGLAICRSIIDQHGGKIWAESTLGVGSTFFFTLPLVRD
ncbi:PAS domain S-box protein [Calothrix sp. FACHB-156]|nr:PAS domain S-box protein [Calothrix sp. FACHB-156]